MAVTFSRNKTTQEWLDSDDILPAGLSGSETDGMGRHKYGDGESTWADLPWPGDNSSDEGSLVQVIDGELFDLDGNAIAVGGGGSLTGAQLRSLLIANLQPGDGISITEVDDKIVITRLDEL